jgi:hypothetical protein
MSLAVLADHMASKGRGPDSMLIHMSPREVQGLQALAENHGGSLTINPETGLPEAGFLDKLLPAIIGVGISYFSGGTIDPKTAGMIVGGIETARTGDIGKGISAGLGAYGGASLGAGMAGAGADAMTTAGMGNYAETLAARGLEAGTPAYGEAASQLALESQQKALATPFADRLSEGANVVKNDPMKYLKANAMPLLYAAGPAILAGESAENNMPKTTTGMIRPYTFDPYSGTYTAGNPYQATPTRAAGGGLMDMDDGGYSPGQLDFTQRSEPVVRMATGGVVALAAGGDYRSLTKDSSVDDIASAYKQFTTAGGGDTAANQKAAIDYLTNLGIGQDKIGQAYGTYQASPTYTAYTPEQIGKYLTDNPTANIAAAAKATNANPADVNRYISNIAAPFVGSTDTTGGSGTLGIYNQMNALGIDPNELYAARIAADPKYAGWSQADIARGYSLDKGALALAAADKDGVSDKEWAAFMDTNKYSVNDMAQAFGLSKNEVQRRYDAAKKAEKPITCGPGFKLNAAGTACEPITKVDDKVDDKVVIGDLVCGPGYKKSIDGKTCVPDTTIVTEETSCPTGQHRDPKTGKCVPNISATQNTTTTVTTPTNIATADKTALPVGVSGAGITTINPNGTVTTRPDLNLPMKDVRDKYTQGGGSLGYTSPTFTSLKEVEDKYPLTGGSKQSYDYLTGKTKYSPVPYTETGEIMKPYSSSVLGIPTASAKQMYVFKNGKYEINPDYAIPTYDKDGKKSSNLTNADVKTFMDKKPSTDAFYTWATTNNLSPEQIAMASGRPINEISKLFTGAKDLVGEDGKIDQTKVDEKTAADEKANFDADAYLKANQDVMDELTAGKANFGTKADLAAAAWEHYQRYGKPEGRKYTKKAAGGGLMNMAMARGGMAQQFNLGDYSDGGRLLRGPGDGVSDSIPASIGNKRPARLADGEFVVPARIVSELGNGSTEAGARKLYAMMDRVQSARRGTVGRGRVAKNSRADKHLPA